MSKGKYSLERCLIRRETKCDKLLKIMKAFFWSVWAFVGIYTIIFIISLTGFIDGLPDVLIEMSKIIADGFPSVEIPEFPEIVIPEFPEYPTLRVII